MRRLLSSFKPLSQIGRDAAARLRIRGSRFESGAHGEVRRRSSIHIRPLCTPRDIPPQLALALVVAAALAAVPQSGNGARSFVVRGDVSIGGYVVDNPPAAAISTFGQPVIKRASSSVCPMLWRSLGLTITFYNLSGGDACSPKEGRFSSADISGAAWRTSKGLKIGDGVARMRLLYPLSSKTKGLSPGWHWLIARKGYRGNTYAALIAQVAKGRIVRFSLAREPRS